MSITRLSVIALALLLIALPGPGQETGTRINILNMDGPGEGFNDPTPATPVGGNSGTTIGQQRLIAFQYAADLWAALLDSTVEIKVESNFDPLECTAESGVLGSAGPKTVFANFDNAPISNMWYVGALANKLAGKDLNEGDPVIRARFNSSLNGSTTCLGGERWYYGLDNDPPDSQTDLVVVVLHELGHGLGFLTIADKENGSFLNNRPDIYSNFLFDDDLGMTWPQMSASQRAASARNTDDLVWIGANAVAAAPSFLDPEPLFIVESPQSVARSYELVVASFSGQITVAGITAPVVAATDAADSDGPSTTDACTAITNPGEVSGRIALIDRGGCTFVTKARNAQDAGARAVIIVNNVAGGPQGMSGDDDTITIPVIGISQADGNAIRGAVPSGVQATIRGDATNLAGTDELGRPKLYAPAELEPGSSVSHWDPSAFPDLLMEPNINDSLGHGVDLSRDLFADLGWFSDAKIEATLRDLLYVDRDRDGFADPGDTIRLVASIQNNGEVTARDVVFDLPVPDVFNVLAVVAPAGTVTDDDERVTVDLGTLPVGQQKLVTIDLRIASNLSRTVTIAQLQGTIAGSNIDTAVTDDPSTVESDDPTVIGINHSPLRAYKSVTLIDDVDDSETLSSGDRLRYYVTIHNNAATTIGNIRFRDDLDSNIDVVPGSVTIGGGGGTIVQGNGAGDRTIIIDFGSIAAGSFVEIGFDVVVKPQVPEGVKRISNQAVVSSGSLADVLSDDPTTQQIFDATLIRFPDPRRRAVRRP